MPAVCHQCGVPCKSSDRFCSACGAGLESDTSQKADPLVGRTVGGAYTLHELVGVGGMGRVYRSEQKALGRTGAGKISQPHLLGEEQTVARFYTEARAASRLNHPNSVSIIDFGRTDDGILYLAMEFLAGKDLALVMHEEGPLPFHRIGDVMLGVLGALAEAHALGVVHRDLKPENIISRRLKSGGDLVKVVDFGLATIVSGAGATSITTPGLVCGTPDYMSPEQGRGETVDGRGDLYSLGVVLFELLTDQLPFNDETPTKVVLRHINDPIPDPLAVAPHRNIPPPLAAVAVRALSKNATDRYRDAEEMGEAVRAALAQATRSESRLVSCPTCGGNNPNNMRYCGSCGARLPLAATPSAPVGATTPPRSSFVPQTVAMRALLGRSEEVAQLVGFREEATQRPVWVHISGEPGAGKTRLVNELAHDAAQAGDLVVGSTAHPTRAPVPYAAVRELLAVLLGVPEAELAKLVASDDVFADPLVRAGISEALDPQGLDGIEGEDRVGAVSAALATAVRVGLERSQSGRVVVIVDDFTLCDGLSQSALATMVPLVEDIGMLLATTGYMPPVSNERARIMTLHGIGLESARAFLSNTPAPPTAGMNSTRLMLPLYLEQVAALGAQPDETLSPRLADAVAQRIDQLDVDSRRVLQAAAVLGDRCHIDLLRGLLDAHEVRGLDTLERKQLVRFRGSFVEIIHPFIRDLVEASIPAEARRTLHERALQLETDRNAPLEVRAEHAYRAGEPMSALMILERMGDLALRRGDAVAGVLAFRRALELGRREMLETGDQMLESAILTFSRKLGEALERSGDVSGSDGVLREALDLAGPGSRERARMLVALAHVATSRDRRRDAARLLGQALEIATRKNNPEVEALVQRGVARVRRADGDLVGAANALRRASELGTELNAPPAARAQVLLELVDVLVELGDDDEVGRHLADVTPLAQQSKSKALLARVTGARAALVGSRGDSVEATSLYHEAARLAAEGGDAISRDRYRTAARGESPTQIA